MLKVGSSKVYFILYIIHYCTAMTKRDSIMTPMKYGNLDTDMPKCSKLIGQPISSREEWSEEKYIWHKTWNSEMYISTKRTDKSIKQ